MEGTISKILSKDLLTGRSKYMKDGFVSFSRIILEAGFDNVISIHLCDGDKKLATMKSEGVFSGLSTFTFNLIEGSMKIEVQE